MRLALADGTTVSGRRHPGRPAQTSQKLVEVDGFDVDVPLGRAPGVPRATTTGPASSAPSAGSLGDAGVNIAGMQVSRDAVGGKAVMVLTVDATVGAEVLEAIARDIEADLVRGVDLV